MFSRKRRQKNLSFDERHERRQAYIRRYPKAKKLSDAELDRRIDASARDVDRDIKENKFYSRLGAYFGVLILIAILFAVAGG